MDAEEWRDVPGLENFYRVSNMGLVASKDRDGKDGRKKLKGRILKITINKKTGQTQLTLSVDGVRYKHEVSQLVAEAFLGECPPGMQACHLDGNNQNNKLSNIAYMHPKAKVAKTIQHYCEPQKVDISEITQQLLQEYFRYEDGELISLKRTGLVVKVGEPAGYRRLKKGVANGKRIHFAGCEIELNRAVYLYHYGVLPEHVMPKDGDFNNCRVENLEACTNSEIAKRYNRIANITKKNK